MVIDQSVIVAAAITRHGRLLLARRTRPPEVAGRWEMPGGRVEPGEPEAQAVQREIWEELGAGVLVGEFIAEHPLEGIGVLRVYAATIDGESGDGEPRLLDHHDQLRWVAPATANHLDMAPGDAGLLPLVMARLGIVK